MNAGWFRCSLSLFLAIALITLAEVGIQNADAQGFGLTSDENANRSWPKLFKNGLGAKKMDSPKPLSLPKLGLFRNVEPNYSLDARPRLFEGFPRLLPERDPSRPNVIQDMNMRSKEFFSRTSDWASRANSNARVRTSNTWETITQGVKRPMGKPLFQNQGRANQPPVRSSQIIESEPKVKF